MAHDWIKMRSTLRDDPDVIAIAIACEIEQDTVVGKLHRLWSWADEHTVDGNAHSVTFSLLNDYISCAGFCEAMESVGWIKKTGNGISFPNFEKHNGKSAKKRALGAKRAAERRAKSNAPKTTNALPTQHNTTQQVNNNTHREAAENIRSDLACRIVDNFGGWMNKQLAIEHARYAIAEVLGWDDPRYPDEAAAMEYLIERARLFKSLRPAAMIPKAEKWFGGEWQFDEQAERERNTKRSGGNARDETAEETLRRVRGGASCGN